VVVAVGLAELLLRSEVAFEAVKLDGAAVLIVLGVRTLPPHHQSAVDRRPRPSPTRGLSNNGTGRNSTHGLRGLWRQLRSKYASAAMRIWARRLETPV
jgi:threonine/homoserine/homoserine lactone efflux protein